MFSFGLCRAKNFKLVHVIGGKATSISHEIHLTGAWGNVLVMPSLASATCERLADAMG